MQLGKSLVLTASFGLGLLVQPPVMFGQVPLALEPKVASSAGGRTVRVAAISFVPMKFELQANAQRLEQAFRRAAEGGAKIAVAPEGILEGYVVNEVISGAANAEQMRAVSIPIDDPVIRQFQALARELAICLVFGFAERVGEEIYNCALFIDDRGEIRGRHHKMQLAEGSHPDWWFNRLGRRSRAFDTPYGRCGIVICNERWNPNLVRILGMDGAQFLVIPSFGSKSAKQDEAVLELAQQNKVPVIEANVGVTLLASDDRIAVVERKEDNITFGEITIPPKRAIEMEHRDRLEKEFLEWREIEMKARFEKTKQHSSKTNPSS